ncbi:MAG: GNAT family N-acetyltransferase [Caldilineaceae bacterium]
MQILVTERLVLRELTLSDADFIHKLLNEPSFIRFIGDRNIRSLDDAENYLLKGPLASYQRHGFGLYLVEEKSNGASLGICGLIKRDTLPDVDIGYAFLPEFWLRGYAFEAAAAVMNYGKAVLKLNRIVAIVTPDNARSIRVLNKLGLSFERTIIWPEDGAELQLYATSI